jgi:hypothetical protein
MPELDYDAMGKEALRQEMRDRELSYSKLNNDGMRAALRANDAEMAAIMADEDSFEMSQEELAAQTGRKSNEITVETASGPTTVDLNKLAIDPSKQPGGANYQAPRTRKGLTIEKDREERNGVKRPSKGGVCREVWDFLDTLTNPTAKDVREAAPGRNWNVNNAMIEFYQWRKFNGISGRAK